MTVRETKEGMSIKVNTKKFDLFYILPIVIITIIFYWDAMEIYFGGVLWDIGKCEGSRHSLYLGGGHVRIVTYALLDALHLLFGLNPLPYHIIVFSIHIINSILVFFIAENSTNNRLISFITAMLFATFWAHGETTIGIGNVTEMLLAFFILSTLVFFYNYRQNPTKLNYSLVLFFAVLALVSKESAPIILVPLIYLTDKYIALESLEFSRTRLSKTPYIPLLLLSLGLLAYLRLHVRGPDHYDNIVYNFVRWIAFTFSFPFLSEEPRWGNVNLILLALFYFFSPIQIRDCISLLMAAVVLLAIPTAPLGCPGPRYIYLSSFFSMTMFTLMLYHGATRLVGIIKVKEDFSRALVIVLCTLLVCHNYVYINEVIKCYDKAGRVTQNLLKAVSSDFPNNTLNAHLVFINSPCELKVEKSIGVEYVISGTSVLPLYYGRSNVGQVSHVNIPEVYDGKYRLFDTVKNITPSEFEDLAKEKGNRVYFFNPKDDSIHNITGKDYTFLKRLVGDS